MSKLVPEVRINKNGVAVTTHVNPEKKGKKTMPTSVAPGGHRDKEREQAVRAAAIAVASYREAMLGGDIDHEVRAILTRTFRDFSEETLKAISDLGDEQLYPDEPSFIFDCIEILASADATEQQYKHLIALTPHLHHHDEMHEHGPEVAVAQLLSLTVYDTYLDECPDITEDRSAYYVLLFEAASVIENLLDNKPEVISRFTDDDEIDYDKTYPGLPLSFTRVLESDEIAFGTPLLTNTELIKLLINNVDRGEELLDLIHERQEFDASVLHDYLHGSHSSLSNGLI